MASRNWPPRAKIVEVGPRDGLQNEPTRVTTEVKVEMIERLVAAGVRVIEAASFVSPKWVPQMADGAEVMRRLPRRNNVVFTALVPNMKGLESALEAGCEEIAVFGSASESFSRKNINCSIAESLERFRPVIEMGIRNKLRVRGYVSCVAGCPYEGPIAPEKVAEVAHWLHANGCYEISLGDTIGVGTPRTTRAMIEACAHRIPVERLAGHYHDTYGMAAANICASLDLGVSVFDSSISGLGGCPYSPGASGNVATEDVVYLMNGLGIETGLDVERLVDAAVWISTQLGRTATSKVARAVLAKRVRALGA
jgi:hydroxymethylglutaryl-CoA lyase